MFFVVFLFVLSSEISIILRFYNSVREKSVFSALKSLNLELNNACRVRICLSNEGCRPFHSFPEQMNSVDLLRNCADVTSDKCSDWKSLPRRFLYAMWRSDRPRRASWAVSSYGPRKAASVTWLGDFHCGTREQEVEWKQGLSAPQHQTWSEAESLSAGTFRAGTAAACCQMRGGGAGPAHV